MKIIFPLVLAAVLGLPAMGGITLIDDFGANPSNGAVFAGSINTTPARNRSGLAIIGGLPMTVSIIDANGASGLDASTVNINPSSAVIDLSEPAVDSVTFRWGSAVNAGNTFNVTSQADPNAISFQMNPSFGDSFNAAVSVWNTAGTSFSLGSFAVDGNKRFILPTGLSPANFGGLSLTFTGVNNIFGGKITGSLVNIQVIPEPSRALLCGLVGAGLLLRRRRK